MLTPRRYVPTTRTRPPRSGPTTRVMLMATASIASRCPARISSPVTPGAAPDATRRRRQAGPSSVAPPRLVARARRQAATSAGPCPTRHAPRAPTGPAPRVASSAAPATRPPSGMCPNQSRRGSMPPTGSRLITVANTRSTTWCRWRGGGSNSIANLFPEAAQPRPGFQEKDQLENEVHRRICAGADQPSLQRRIASDWLALFHALGLS